ncbi:MAG: alpha/beta hydrolase, partial [Sedimentisphaerales bacterium]|nr:alpha/beta hydrolase [Sedimentisphaerales bacterium]
MMLNRKNFLSLLLSTILTVCSAGYSVASTKSPDYDILVKKDIVYREGNSKAWKLDMAMPVDSGSEQRPALVIIHGGGWASGSKSIDVYQNMMTNYARKGYVIISVGYRLTGETPFPACIEDCKCAVRWLRAHAQEYRIDPERIGAYGHSAGAHLALMLAMTTKEDGLEGDGGWDDFSSRVNVVAAGSPPTELGRNIPMANERWWPIGHISADNPPMLLIQGGNDNIVRPVLTDYFVEKMKIAGADIEYLQVPEAGHGLAYGERLDITDPAIEKFLNKYLKPSAPKTIGNVAEFSIIEDGGTGPFPAIMTSDKAIAGHTIFRPRDLGSFSKSNPLPVIVWANGACANSPWEHVNFLSEIASHGFLVIATGVMPPSAGGNKKTNSSQLLEAISWSIAQNSQEASEYFGKIAVDKIAASGMSCGGLQTLEIAADPRLSTIVIYNSGVLPDIATGMPGMPKMVKSDLKNIHTPVMYVLGGEKDIAYNNGMDDFERINHVPAFVANLNVGHGGTFAQKHGGEFAIVATAWYKWHLKGDAEAAKLFTGDNYGLSEMPGWKSQKK